MAKQDDFVKTALRLPRALHIEIQAAAEASGRSMNAEMIDRLQAQPGQAMLAAMLDRVRSSEGELLETARKQRDLLWSIVDRTEDVLTKADVIAERNIATDHDAITIRRSIGSLLELIKAIKIYR
jgi:hypothetical protein